jgi:hypothetical protein
MEKPTFVQQLMCQVIVLKGGKLVPELIIGDEIIWSDILR